MAIQAVEYEWEKWLEIAQTGVFDDVQAAPQGPIQPVHWNSRWLPLTDDGSGNHYCVDLDPASGGHVGQIIWFHHERGPVGVVSASFSDWLGEYANDLEAGRYMFEPPYEMVEASDWAG